MQGTKRKNAKDVNRWKCNLCKKVLKSKRALEYHLERAKVPCHLQCEKCGNIARTVADYKTHEKTHKSSVLARNSASQKIAEQEREIENLKLQLQVREQAEQIRLLQEGQIRGQTDDKNTTHRILEQLFLEEKMPIQDFETVGKIIEENDDVRLEYERITTIKEKLVFVRKRNARKVATPKLVNIAMEALHAHSDLNNVGQNMMCTLLASKEPRLQNVFFGEFGAVRVWSRNSTNELCNWILYEKEAAANVLDQYARTMFAFLLTTGVELLVFVLYKGQICLAFHGIGTEEKPLSCVVGKNDEGDELRPIAVSTGELLATHKKDDSLLEMVKKREGQVLYSHLKNVALRFIELKNFGQKYRPDRGIQG